MLEEAKKESDNSEEDEEEVKGEPVAAIKMSPEELQGQS